MPNDKELYLHLFRANEQAVRLLIEAQRECEEQYLAEDEPVLRLWNDPEESFIEEE